MATPDTMTRKKKRLCAMMRPSPARPFDLNSNSCASGMETQFVGKGTDENGWVLPHVNRGTYAWRASADDASHVTLTIQTVRWGPDGDILFDGTILPCLPAPSIDVAELGG
jgi:hypothetical protein